MSFSIDPAGPVSRAVRLLACLGLCAAYIQGGLVKWTDFDGALAEMAHFGLAPPAVFAVAVIVLELVASAMVLTGILRWAGALALGGFTLLATLLALRFWEMPQGQERLMTANAFFEHIGLAGGFVLVAWLDLAGAARGRGTGAGPLREPAR
ncbi:DoxX family protein [Oceanicella sp. SM1341]|uniref:DoxX family protein n=1 Tax=Oceanicella sp. SM1341 TaxID=1548889 RepID=UPI000E4BFD3D|nr:DoxX family protein [Oceanicella sp. SM1341]